MNSYFHQYCNHFFHYFLRDEDDRIAAFHADDSECTLAEFNFADIRNDEMEKIVECPQCSKRPASHDHIKICIGYHQQPTINEIVGAYGDPTDAAKREAVLRRCLKTENL